MGLIADLAAFVCDADVGALPALDRAVQRRHVADAIVAARAGRATGEADALRRAHARADGAPGCDDAAALACAIVRHTEIDDIHLPSCTTPSSVAVPLALALAGENAAPHDVASAIWVATELIVRLGMAIDGPNVLYRGVWPTCFAAPLGAAAVASRLMRLDAGRTSHALSLALMSSAGRTGRFHGSPPGRWILFVGAVAEGLRATRAAAAGFVGDPALLDGQWMQQAQGLPLDRAKLVAGLGEGSVYPALSLKPFCTARQALSPTLALMQILDDGVAPDAIRAVRVRVPSAYAPMISQAVDPANRSSGFVSVGFQMGLSAHRRESLWDVDRSAVMRDPAVLDFARRVSVEPDAALQAEFPARWPGRVEVDVGGETIVRETLDARGDPARRLDDAAVADKAHRILDPSMGEASVDRLLATAMTALEEPAALAALLAGDVA